MNLRKRGAEYEKLASEFLVQKGYQIIALNYRFSRNEIDIVCSLDNELVFVEVKGGRSADYGNPIFRVDQKKQDSIIKAANGFLQGSTTNYSAYRFDVVVIDDGKSPPEIEHIKSAFTL